MKNKEKMIVLILLTSSVSFVLTQKYEGCFRSSADDPDLPSLILSRASTPAECTQECKSRYYMFAGLMNGQQCYCGSRFGRNGLSSSCTIRCATDPSNFCGSREAMSIYSTGQKGPSPPRRITINPKGIDSLHVTWEPPDISNGEVVSYSLRAVAIETYAADTPHPVQSEIQGGYSNSTILMGLQPGTKYNISITASNAQESSEPASEVSWTLIGPPNKPVTPKIIEQRDNTITVALTEATSEYGPISFYRILIVQPGTIPPDSEDAVYTNYQESVDQGLGYYIAAEFDSSNFPNYKRFVIGDGKRIGEYYNAPLDTRFAIPQIGLGVVSRARGQTRYAYSDLTSNLLNSSNYNRSNATAIVLTVAIVLLGALLIASVLVYFALRQRHKRFRTAKNPEQQELTLQGPLYEIDNMGYIPEDVPERVDHYQELKKKVWSIPRNALSIDDVILRRGRFGSVHTGMVNRDGQSLNVIVHSIADSSLRTSEKRNMLRELDMCIRATPMKYLIGLVGTCETPEMLFIALEKPSQTLKNRLLAARSGDIFPVGEILPIASAIAAALRHLESYKIVHTCLCARSVGICDDWTPKLMGFGIGKHSMEDIKYARWTAIECFDNSQKRQQSAVVWAFGVLLWEMFSMGGTPYSNLKLDSEVEEAVGSGVRLPQLLDITDPIYEVMSSCWQADPHERPTFDELMRLDTLTTCPITSIGEEYIPELEFN